MKKYIFLLLFFFFTITSQAQTIRIADSREFLFSDFYVAILAGVLLALIFQIVLTALSVAMGITMIGNVKKKFAESQAKLDSERGSNEYILESDNDFDFSGVKFSSAFGVWSLITTTISLFGACALALNLSFFGTIASNLTISLVIWALFYMILFYLESKIVHTLIGGLITTATAGLKFSAGIVKDLFNNSPNTGVENTIEKTIEKVRKDFDEDKISKTIKNFLENISTDHVLSNPKMYDELESELNTIIDKPSESLESTKSKLVNLNAKKLMDLVKETTSLTSEEVETISSKIKQIVQELKERTDKIQKEINEKVKLAKRQTVIQAEHARKTAASAAWWLVLTVVLSGATAMLGGYLELMK